MNLRPSSPAARALLSSLAALWVLFILLAFFRHYPLPVRQEVVLERLRDLSVALALALAAALAGARLVRILGLARVLEQRAARALAGMALGYGALGLAALALARLHWLRPAPLVVLAVLILAVSWQECSAGLHAAHRWWGTRGSRPPADAFRVVLLVVLGVCMALMLLEALAPPTAYDSLRYQLRLPRLYAEAGGWVDVSHDFNAAFPGNVNMLYSIAFTVGAPGAAKLTHLFLGWLAAGAVGLLGVRAAGPGAGLPAAAIFYSMPVVALNSAWAYVDMGMTLHLLLAVAAVMSWWRRPDPRWIVLAGLLTGLALGTKYTAAAALLLLPAAILLRPMRAGCSWRKATFGASILVVLALLVSAPWWGSNWAQRGNPVYPFAASFFPADEGDSYRADRHRAVLSRPEVPTASATDVLALPWRFAMRPWVDDEMIGPALLVAVPLLLLARGGGAGPLLLFALGFAALWGFLSPQIRLYLHGLGLLSAAAGASVAVLRARGGALNRWLLGGLLAALLLSLGNLAVLQKELSDPFGVVLGMESRGRYLGRMVPGHKAIAFINRELPADARVLFVGEIYGYYCERDYVLGSKFDRAPLVDLIAPSQDATDLQRRLQEAGFTHVLYSMHQLQRFSDLAAPGSYLDWPDEESRALYRDFMVNRLEMLHEGPDAVVARIVYDRAGEPHSP